MRNKTLHETLILLEECSFLQIGHENLTFNFAECQKKL